MRHIYTYFALSAIILLSSCISSRSYTNTYTPESPDNNSDITYQQFYDGLSPYGNWVEYQNYGYLWVPDEPGFRPYYNNGQWVYTNYGWTWASNYNWGWAPFHYGRWLYDDAYGWMWMPGYEWAPAWVSWRNSDDYYGWAPMGPDRDFNMNGGQDIPYGYWAFVPHRYINSPRINNYYVDRQQNVTIINNTTVINNTTYINNNKTVYVMGPSATEVEKVTNEKITPAKIIPKKTPGNTEVFGSSVSIYRPGVKQTSTQNAQIKPVKIVNLHDLQVRRENAGGAQNETPVRNDAPARTGGEKTIVPADTKREPVFNQQKVTNNPPVNETTKPVTEKANTDKETRFQQPQKYFPPQQTPDVKPENINKGKNNDPQTQNNQPPVIPPVINNQPPKVRTINPNPDGNKIPDRVRFNNNSPVPNKQPDKTQQNNTVKPQQRLMLPGSKQVTTPPVNRTPTGRNQNPEQTRENPRENPREDVPQKDRDKK